MERLIDLIRDNLKIILGIIIVLVIISLIITLISRNSNSPKVILGEKTFTLDLAKTQKEKEVGLSGRKDLGEEKGMLFLFEKEGFYPFWMKDMKFALDIIFINGDKIVTIYKNVKPPREGENPSLIYQPTDKADKVLEVNAGISDKLGLKVGNTLKFEDLK